LPLSKGKSSVGNHQEQSTTPERLSQIEELFHAAREREPGEWASFLAAACREDEELRREVESLLAAEGASSALLSAPIREAATMLASQQVGSQLAPGVKLGPYLIEARLGSGGMGEVYRARDSRLKREVAIKVLPVNFARDPDRIARFEHEARAASALNHPNIVHIYDIADGDGVQFIAMEYVDGKPLNELIPRKGMRLTEALRIATQVADALTAAHAAGIVHRDLKPANIMVDVHGRVKVLDFGLAKLSSHSVALGADEATHTLTAQHPVTEEGIIIGGVPYMSPEQAEGKPVDTRSDIFSFGSVLYEMVTGRRAFHGDSKILTLSAILKEEPAPLPTENPRELDKIIARCLRKDPGRRYQHAVDLKLALLELTEESESGKLTPAPPVARTRGGSWLAFGLCGLMLLVGAFEWFRWQSKPAKTKQHSLTRLTSNGMSFRPTISSDGKLLAYESSSGGPNPDIFVQQIGGGKAIQVTHEKEGASSPVFSPAGTQIAYESRGRVYEIPALGGDTRLITEDGFFPLYAQGGSTIIFFRIVREGGKLFTMSRMGGTPPVPIQPDLTIGSAIVSPDGNKILSQAFRNGTRDQDLKRWWMISIPDGKLEEIAPPPMLSGETDAPQPLAWTALEKHPGQWVLFRRAVGDADNLFRITITSEGKVTSDPDPLTFSTGVDTSPSISETGRMVFASEAARSTNLWSIPIDTNRARLTGELQRLTQVEGVSDGSPSVSSDGKKVAFFSERSLVVKDLVTGRETQLAQDVMRLSGTPPIISPDGTFVVYYVLNKTKTETDLYLISSAGGVPRRFCQDCGTPKGFSSDGTRILTQKGHVGGHLLSPA